MRYHKLIIAEGIVRWMADPQTPEELKYTLEFESECYLSYDPNEELVEDPELTNMFL